MNFVRLILVQFLVSFISCNKPKYNDLTDGLYADIETIKGDILLNLEYKNVPITTANFVSLAEGNNIYVDNKFKRKSFYKGLTFHRVVPNFMIQGGDPNANGLGGPGYVFENEHPKKPDGSELFVFDKPGVLAMANSGRDANGSQFFITHTEYESLNGGYTIFGHVLKGQNVVDSIAIGDKINKINIIRVGKEAQMFNAPQIFREYFSVLEAKAKLKQEEVEKNKAEFLAVVEENKKKANELASGLKMLIIKEGSGVKPKSGTDVRIEYAGFYTDGNMFATNNKDLAHKFNKYDQRAEDAGVYNPFSMVYSTEATLVPGFREGMLNMNYGDRAMLFVPAHLGYGEQGNKGIPPNTDLIFEIEIVDQRENLED